MRLQLFHFFLLLTVGLLPAAVNGIELRVLSWSGAINDLTLTQGTARKGIVLRANEDALSPVYHLTSKEPLKLYRTQPDADPESRTLVATLPLPADIDQAILVLAPASPDGHAYAGLWIDDSLKERPVDTVSVRNLTSRPVALKMDADQVMLSPQASHLQRFQNGTRVVMIQAAVQEGDSWSRVVSTPQPVKPGFRILILLRDGRRMPDGSTSAIDRVTFYDYSPPAVSP